MWLFFAFVIVAQKPTFASPFNVNSHNVQEKKNIWENKGNKEKQKMSKREHKSGWGNIILGLCLSFWWFCRLQGMKQKMVGNTTRNEASIHRNGRRLMNILYGWYLNNYIQD